MTSGLGATSLRGPAMGAAAGILCQSEASEGSRGTWHWEDWGPLRGRGVQGLVAAACPWRGKGEGLARAAERWPGCTGSKVSLTGSSPLLYLPWAEPVRRQLLPGSPGDASSVALIQALTGLWGHPLLAPPTGAAAYSLRS